jgi:hypothetical protein
MNSCLPTSTNITINFRPDLNLSQIIYTTMVLNRRDNNPVLNQHPLYYQTWRKVHTNTLTLQDQSPCKGNQNRFSKVSVKSAGSFVSKTFLYATTVTYSVNAWLKVPSQHSSSAYPLFLKWLNLNSQVWGAQALKTYWVLAFLLCKPLKTKFIGEKSNVKVPLNPFLGLQYL